MTNNTQNPLTDNVGGSNGSKNQANNKPELVLTFDLLRRGFTSDRYRERKIWKDGDTHLIALSPICDPDEFSDPNCDCRSYYTKDVLQQLREKTELHNGWKTCLYQFWNDFVRSTQFFDDCVPEMFNEKWGYMWSDRYVWFVIRTRKDIDYIKGVLSKAFESEIKFK